MREARRVGVSDNFRVRVETDRQDGRNGWRGCAGTVGSRQLTLFTIFVARRFSEICSVLSLNYLLFNGADNPVFDEPTHHASPSFSITANGRQLIQIGLDDGPQPNGSARVRCHTVLSVMKFN
jgi:hypothetical protein